MVSQHEARCLKMHTRGKGIPRLPRHPCPTLSCSNSLSYRRGAWRLWHRIVQGGLRTQISTKSSISSFFFFHFYVPGTRTHTAVYRYTGRAYGHTGILPIIPGIYLQQQTTWYIIHIPVYDFWANNYFRSLSTGSPVSNPGLCWKCKK